MNICKLSYDVLKKICIHLSFRDLKYLQRTCKFLLIALNSEKLCECWHWKYGVLWNDMPRKNNGYTRNHAFDSIVHVLLEKDELGELLCPNIDVYVDRAKSDAKRIQALETEIAKQIDLLSILKKSHIVSLKKLQERLDISSKRLSTKRMESIINEFNEIKQITMLVDGVDGVMKREDKEKDNGEGNVFHKNTKLLIFMASLSLFACVSYYMSWKIPIM